MKFCIEIYCVRYLLYIFCTIFHMCCSTELLRRSAEHILTDLTQLLFTRLAEMSEDDQSGAISRVGAVGGAAVSRG